MNKYRMSISSPPLNNFNGTDGEGGNGTYSRRRGTLWLKKSKSGTPIFKYYLYTYHTHNDRDVLSNCPWTQCHTQRSFEEIRHHISIFFNRWGWGHKGEYPDQRSHLRYRTTYTQSYFMQHMHMYIHIHTRHQDILSNNLWTTMTVNLRSPPKEFPSPRSIYQAGRSLSPAQDC